MYKTLVDANLVRPLYCPVIIYISKLKKIAIEQKIKFGICRYLKLDEYSNELLNQIENMIIVESINNKINRL